MARIEKQSITCKPSDENSIIQKFQKFGWTLDSSQEIYNKDSHIEGRRDGNYSVTTTTNYVKLVFARDKDMPYYDEIARFEAEYSQLEANEPHKSAAGSVIAWIFGLLLLFAGFVGMESGGVIFLLLGGGLIAITIIRNKKRNAEYDSSYNEWSKKKSVILQEVQKYV